MSAQHPILSRLETGRPLLASADPEASLRARGVTLKWPAAIAVFLLDLLVRRVRIFDRKFVPRGGPRSRSPRSLGLAR